MSRQRPRWRAGALAGADGGGRDPRSERRRSADHRRHRPRHVRQAAPDSTATRRPRPRPSWPRTSPAREARGCAGSRATRARFAR